MRPNIDNLVVALAIGNNAFAILLLDSFDLFVSVIEFDLFFLGNDHVRNSNRDTGFRRLAEAQLFELVERLHRPLLARDLIAAPDNVAQLLLARGSVEKANI